MGSGIPLGHSAAYEFLVNSFSQGKASHAYLFLGPKGVGKTALTEQALKYLWCQATTNKPCGDCSTCRQVSSRSYPDLCWITRLEGKQDISIDQVRELKAFTNLASLAAGFRAVVIEAAENLTTEASNALLKVLEEPLGKTVFFLTASEAKQLLPTVRSRCFIMHLGLVPTDEIKRFLVQTYKKSATRASELAHLVGGRPGVAVALAGDDEELERRHSLAERYLELWHQPSWPAWQAWFNQELTSSDDSRGRTLIEAQKWLAIWLEIGRDLILVKLKLSSFVRYQTLLDKLELAVKHVTLSELLKAVRLIMQARHKLASNANIRLTLEWLTLTLSAKA